MASKVFSPAAIAGVCFRRIPALNDKKGVPEGTPLNQLSVKTNYGVRNRKNCDGVEVVIGMALENVPAPSNTLCRLVVHVAIGFATLVVVNQA